MPEPVSQGVPTGAIADRAFGLQNDCGTDGQATQLLADGVHPKAVSERLGHASISIALDTYSHVMPGMQEEAAKKIDAALRKALAG
jgi:integrase